LAPRELVAGLTLLTTRTGTDTIDWGQLGPDGTALTSPFTVTTAKGLSASVSQPQDSAERVDEGGGNWNGNFAMGAKLLYSGNYTTGGSAPITIDFGSTALRLIGFQIQDANPGDFTAKIEAFDSKGTSLGYVTENGFSASTQDNSAIFIGVESSDHNISKIVVSDVSPSNSDANNFAVNYVSLSQFAAVPEPSTLLSLVLGGFAAGGHAIRRRRQV
jgi:hypothetical protein